MVGRTGQTLLCLALACAALLAAGGDRASARTPDGFFGATLPTGQTALSVLPTASAGGVRTLRAQFNWAAVESTPGVRNFAGFDSIVRNAAASNIRVLPMLFGVPAWAADNAATPPIGPSVRSAWASFTADLAARYGSNGTFWAANPELPRFPITLWQVWNEVNLSFYWGGPPNAREYVNLLALTNGGLRSGDPAARTLMAGLIPFKSAAAGTVSGEKYLSRLLRIKRFRGLTEGVAIHPYGRGAGVASKALVDIRRFLNRNGGRRESLWATEFGWSTGGEGWNSSPFRATPAAQASRVSRVYRAFVKNQKRLKLRMALYFSLTDADQPGTTDDWSAFMGLFDLQGQAKPAWSAFANQASKGR
jgi:hypothetical protein